MAPVFALFLESSQLSSWTRAEKIGEEGIPTLYLLSPKVSHLTSFHIPLRTSYMAPLREGRLGNEVQLCLEENRVVAHPYDTLLVDMVWEGDYH